MIKEFVKYWEDRKYVLKNAFATTRQEEYSSYDLILKMLLDYVINPCLSDDDGDYDCYKSDDVHVIDDGDYQGTLIMVVHKNCYQPSCNDYIYTSVGYGSCSGCDTLLSISGYDNGIPTKEQVEDYMILALHLLQNMHFMREGE